MEPVSEARLWASRVESPGLWPVGVGRAAARDFGPWAGTARESDTGVHWSPHMPDTNLPSLVYYDFPTSPFCAKVRSVLMYQRAEFTTVNALAPRRWLALRRHGTGKVPALEIDGRMVVDSTDICHALDALFPQRPVIPPDPRERALCHAIEEWCDESLYFIGLRHVWLDPANAKMVRRRFAPGPVGWLAWRGYRRLICTQVRGQGTGRKSDAHIEADLRRHLDAAEALLDSRDFLLSDRPWLCDFALFGQLRFIGFAAAGAAALALRPALSAYSGRVRQACGLPVATTHTHGGPSGTADGSNRGAR